MLGSRTSGYIELPFSPAYVEKLAPYFAQTKQGNKFYYTENDFYSYAQIEDFLTRNRTKKDLPRTPWIVEPSSAAKSSFYPSPAALKIASEEKGIDINLTEKEAKALGILTTFTGQKFFQGGCPGIIQETLWVWLISLLNATAISFPGLNGRTNRIIRAKDQLQVEHHVVLTGRDEKDPTLPLIKMSFRNDIRESAAGFTFSIDRLSYKIEIEKSFFKEKMLPVAYAKLAATQFTEEDLFFLTPFLVEPAFAEKFYQKIQELPPNKAQIALIVQHCVLCFSLAPPVALTYWEQHKKKVFGTILGSTLALVLFIMGGLILITAAGAVLVIGAGMLLGARLDNKHVEQQAGLFNAGVLHKISTGEFNAETERKPSLQSQILQPILKRKGVEDEKKPSEEKIEKAPDQTPSPKDDDKRAMEASYPSPGRRRSGSGIGD
jgi:hypothetical protein